MARVVVRRETPTTLSAPGHRAVRTGAALYALADPVRAHVAETGLGPFFDGIAHLFISPEQLLTLLAVSLLAGLCGRPQGRVALLVLLVLWPVAGFLGLWTGSENLRPVVESQYLVGATLMLLGGLATFDARMSRGAMTIVIAPLAALSALTSGMAIDAAGLGYGGLAGTVAAVLTVATLVVAMVIRIADHRLGRFVARVAGSWLAASGMLWVGWALR